MPAQYRAILAKLVREGMKKKLAEKHAVKIFNSKHPKNPVGRERR